MFEIRQEVKSNSSRASRRSASFDFVHRFTADTIRRPTSRPMRIRLLPNPVQKAVPKVGVGTNAPPISLRRRGESILHLQGRLSCTVFQQRRPRRGSRSQVLSCENVVLQLELSLIAIALLASWLLASCTMVCYPKSCPDFRFTH